MWYIKTQHTSHLKASFSKFCAAWVAAGLRSRCISSFFLALIHPGLGSRGDSYRCAGSGTGEASRHLEGRSWSECRCSFKLTGANTVDVAHPHNMISAVVSGSKSGYMLPNNTEYMLSCLSGIRAHSLISGLCICLLFLVFVCDTSETGLFILSPRVRQITDLTSHSL